MGAAHSLFKKHTKTQLLVLLQEVEAAPASQAPPGGLFRLTPAARKRTADITQAISWHIEAAREAAGKSVPVAGYSGRRSNRVR